MQRDQPGCNPLVTTFIRTGVLIRATLLLAALCSVSAFAQSPTAAQPGASPSRANGVPPQAGSAGAPANPSASATPAAQSQGGAQTQGNSRQGNAGQGSGVAQGGAQGGAPATANRAPAAKATDKVEVIGSGSSRANRTGTSDKPLLPIASFGNALGIHSGTAIQVRLKQNVDSGTARNGQMLDGTLAKPVAGLAAGTPVRLTVVAAAAAGTLNSFGELSLQLVSIAEHRVLSQTVTAQGKEGTKELPDAAPARGTEAIFTAGQPITLPAA